MATASTTRLERERERVEEICSELTCLRASYAAARRRKDAEAMGNIASQGHALRQELAQYSAQATMRMYIQQGLTNQVRDEVMLLLCWAQDLLNVQNPLTADQLENCATLIVHTYAWLRKEDVAICLRQALAGEYGKLYAKMDVQDVLGWVMRYAETLQQQRAEAAAEARARAKERPGDPIADSLRAAWKRIESKPIN